MGARCGVDMKTYTLREAAELLHCSYDHAKRNWKAWGGVKPGRRVIFSEEAIRTLLRCSTGESIHGSITLSSSTVDGLSESPLAKRIKEMRRELRKRTGKNSHPVENKAVLPSATPPSDG